ncbi:MAG: uroporphyrinogen-III synthase, partial [Muribaculaceae bacterium]|nr:uroporphyrinogen-III synthase [Muribaculaceae bacterium]
PQLIQSMVKNKEEKFLYPISDVNKDNLSALDANEIPYTKAVMYRTVSNDFTPDEPFDYDLLLFFSPAGIDSLKKNFPDFDQDRDRKYIGTFGAPAAKAVEDAGLRLDFAAPTPEALSMPAALDAFLTGMAEAETEDKTESEVEDGTEPAEDADTADASDASDAVPAV